MSLYSSTDRLIERVQFPGEVSTMNQFLMRDADYSLSEGQLNLLELEFYQEVKIFRLWFLWTQYSVS